MAMQVSLWLDVRDQFGEEHVEEWEAQEYRTAGLNDLERETELVYWDCVLTKRDDKECADSKEAAAQELPPERHATRVERQACTMPTKVDVSSTNARVPLYPNWVVRCSTKPPSHDAPMHYRAPKESAASELTLEEELDVASILDPLKPDSQSSHPDASENSGTEGPWMPPHYCDAQATIPPFDLSRIGILPKMSPVTEQENELLNMAPGSPVRHQAPPGLSLSRNRSQRSSYSGSPMLLGSPARTSSLVRALQVRTHLVTPAILSRQREQDVDERMDAAETGINEDED